MRVLCIAPAFLTRASAESFCGRKVALHLLDAGVDLSVFDVDYSGHAMCAFDPSPLWSPLSRITSSFPPDGGKFKAWSLPLGLWYRTPEWSRWVSTIVAAADAKHRSNPYDLVYSRGLPNVAHVAAYWVTRAIHRPWVANFNDPWDLEARRRMPQHRASRRRTATHYLSSYWLGKVMRTAEVITFPCARLRDYHLRLYQRKGRCTVIPHIGQAIGTAAPSRDFQLVHAGNLGCGESTRQNATLALLRAIRIFLDQHPDAASRFQVTLVGPEDIPTCQMTRSLHLEQHVICTGKKTYEESLKYIAHATVCLLVEGNMAEGIYLPSKFADYIAAGRPVIALSPPIGTIADLQPSIGVMRVSVEDERAIVRALTAHYDAFAEGRIATLSPTRELQSLYDGPLIARTLCDLFSKLRN